MDFNVIFLLSGDVNFPAVTSAAAEWEHGLLKRKKVQPASMFISQTIPLYSIKRMEPILFFLCPSPFEPPSMQPITPFL